MAYEEDDEARHMIVVKEEEAGYAIVAKAKEVVEAGSATVA